MSMQAGEQRWTRPLDVEPGHWKKQLPIKRLRIAARGDVDGLRTHLAVHPQDLNRRANHGRTLLWEAVRAGKLDAVEYLVEAGADVDLTGSYNNESLVQLTPFCAAVYYRRKELVPYLKKRSHPPDNFRQAFLGEADPVLRQIDVDPSLLALEDPQDQIYFTPLVSFAVAGGHYGLTEQLIAKGAQIANYSSLLLILAARNGRVDLVELLVASGASTKFMAAALIVTKDISVFRRLLELNSSMDAGKQLKGLTLLPIVRGDRAERPDKIAALLDHGISIDARGPGGETALHMAAASARLKVLALLLERGADPAITDKHGRTALHIAQVAGNTDAATLLSGGRPET